MKTLKSKSETTVKQLDAELAAKLDGKTVNDAITAGIITSLGVKGQFIFSHSDENIDRTYAVVNGFAVPCSTGLAAKEKEEVEEMLGDLTFSSGFSIKKYKANENGVREESDAPDAEAVPWFRLGLPKGVNLGEGIVDLAYDNEPAAAGN